jgi:hypothetical protein
MPACARRDPALGGLLALVLALGGCADPDTGGRFTIDRLEAHWAAGRLDIACEQQLQLSAEARDALQHGVPLTIELELILRGATTQARVSTETRRYEIRYLPLSEHYRVTGIGANNVATFPRLRHALAELSRLELSFETGALPAGDYEVLARSRLDQRRMPPPMRLPALFDRSWKHASPWVSAPLTVEPRT